MEPCLHTVAPVPLPGTHLIDVEILAEQGWLTAAEIDNPPSQDWVGNGPIQEWLLPKIFTAAERFAKAKRIKAFIKDEDWVEDWAHFQCLIKELAYTLGKTSQPTSGSKSKALAK